MGDVLIRNVKDTAIVRLKGMAARHSRSLESELRLMLEAEAEWDERIERFTLESDRIRSMQPDVDQTDSAILRRIGRRGDDLPVC